MYIQLEDCEYDNTRINVIGGDEQAARGHSVTVPKHQSTSSVYGLYTGRLGQHGQRIAILDGRQSAAGLCMCMCEYANVVCICEYANACVYV
jgi:hypothetical protein